MNWDEVKQNIIFTPYPEQTFPIPQDHTGWSTEACLNKLSKLAKQLTPDQVVIELGSFIGATSTNALLRGNEDVRLICVDTFATKPEHVTCTPFGNTPFMRHIGTQWKHFVNNTWFYKDRIAIVYGDANPTTLRNIYELDVDVRLVYIDADHEEGPIYDELSAIASLWPKATIALDDYMNDWPGIKAALDRAIESKIFSCNDSFDLIDNRLMVIHRGLSL